MKIILTISIFSLFFASGLKAQNRVAGRVDPTGTVTYTTHFNQPQPAPVINTITETQETSDTFNVELPGKSLKFSAKDIKAMHEKATQKNMPENSPKEPVKKEQPK